MPIVRCKNCGHKVDKPLKTYNQQIKRGCKNFFCDHSCSSSFSMRNRHAEWRKTHIKKTYQYKDRKKKTPEHFALSSIAGRIAGRCRERGEASEINTKNLEELWNKQQGLCAYSGVKMCLGRSERTAIIPEQMSVDRIDPLKGYTLNNVVLCCYWINVAKMKMSRKDFEDKIKHFANHLM